MTSDAQGLSLNGLLAMGVRHPFSKIGEAVEAERSEPLTTRDIALQMLVERALNKDDQRLLRLMTKRNVALQRGQNIVRSGQGPSMFMMWEIVRQAAKKGWLW
jgi:hypothetical protein